MFNQHSTLGWILIIGLIIFIVTLNIGLFVGVKKKIEKDHWINKLSDAGQVLRNPLKKENEQYQELADMVAKIKPAAKEDVEDKQDTLS